MTLRADAKLLDEGFHPLHRYSPIALVHEGFRANPLTHRHDSDSRKAIYYQATVGVPIHRISEILPGSLTSVVIQNGKKIDELVIVLLVRWGHIRQGFEGKLIELFMVVDIGFPGACRWADVVPMELFRRDVPEDFEARFGEDAEWDYAGINQRADGIGFPDSGWPH